MIVNEIFTSVEGEGIRAGRLCTFIRFTGCNLRCSWCDTTYAFDEGKEMSVTDILDSVPKDARLQTVFFPFASVKQIELKSALSVKV